LDACTCIAFEFARDVDQFPIILMGKAVERTDHRTSDQYRAMIDVSFQVLQVWRGEVPGDITIRTNRQESACGYPFVAGQHYVVFVQRDLSPGSGAHWLLETHSCTPTAPASKAASLITQLDAHFGKRTRVSPGVD
jgi:hypothetical protein